MKKALISLALCAGVVVLGTVVILKAFANRRQETRPRPQIEERLTNVHIQIVNPEAVEDVIILTGSIEPWKELIVSAETAGRIELLDVDEGDRVRTGDEIVKINTTSIQASIDRDRARLSLSEQELSRIRELRDEGISSPQELDRALTDRDSAKANLRLSEIQLDQSVIAAQFDGVVDTSYVKQGEFANVGAHLLRLIQVHKVKAVIGLAERDVALFALGDPVSIVIDAYPDRTFNGAIFRIAASAEAETRSFATEIELDNNEGLIRPGMIARARFVRRLYEDAVTVPMFSIVTRSTKRVVFVEEDGIATTRPVEVGFFRNDFAHITDGLKEGDRVVVLGQRNLREGEHINIQRVLD